MSTPAHVIDTAKAALREARGALDGAPAPWGPRETVVIVVVERGVVALHRDDAKRKLARWGYPRIISETEATRTDPTDVLVVVVDEQWASGAWIGCKPLARGGDA